jgi:hypothetical protein
VTMSSRSLFTVEPGDHLCISYQDEDENRKLTSAHLTTALERGHRIVYVVDDASTDTVLCWLTAQAPVEPRPLLARGQLAMRSADEFAFTAGGFDPDLLLSSLADESMRAGRPVTRACGCAWPPTGSGAVCPAASVWSRTNVRSAPC